jgi:capsular exopolysaccharide synthesis family protein
MTPQRLTKLARRWALVIVALMVAGAAAAYLTSRVLTPTYSASGVLVVRAASTQSSTAFSQTANQVTATDSALVTQLPIRQQVIKELGLPDTPEQLRARITVAPQQTTNLIDVTVSDNSPKRAAEIANRLMSDFVTSFTSDNQARIAQAGAALAAQIASLEDTLAGEQSQLARAQVTKSDTATLQQQIQANGALLTQLTTNFSSFQSQQAQALDSIVIASPATAPLTPSSPQKTLNTLLGALVGLLIGFGIAAFFEYVDQGLRNPDDVRERLGLPTLAVIPKFVSSISGVAHSDKRTDAAGEAYRRLRTNIMFASVDGPTTSVVIVSVAAGEGKSRTAANVAAVMAAAGQNVLLVDADMRRPTQHRLFGRPLRDGLSELLLVAAHGTPPAIDGRFSTNVPNLSVITAGMIPPNPSELLASKHTAGVVRYLQNAFELVVFDTPPTALVTDALTLASTATATVIVVEPGKSNARAVGYAIESLRSVGANVLGVVLNKAQDREMRGYAEYYGGYGYTSDASEDRDPPLPTSKGRRHSQSTSNGHQEKSGQRQTWEPIGAALPADSSSPPPVNPQSPPG